MIHIKPLKVILKSLHCFVIAFVFICTCCKKNNGVEKYTTIEPLLTDSFTVNGIGARCNLQSFHVLNDSELISFSYEGNIVSVYKKSAINQYNLKKQICLGISGYLRNFFKSEDGNFYACDDSLILYSFNKNFELVDSSFIKSHFPFLKNKFILFHKSSGPAKLCSDTLIAAYVHADFDDYPKLFKENVFAKFVRSGKIYLKSEVFLNYPANLQNYFLPIPSFLHNKNKIITIFPCYDTLYIYDKNSGKAEKIPIHNEDYKIPQPYDLKHVSDFAFNTKYFFHNFMYSSIYYNPSTEHYLLIYTKALLNSSEKKEHNLKPSDNKKLGMILDKNFKLIDYVKFNREYGDITNELFMPGKGLCLPLTPDKTNYEKTTFYFYNF